METSEIVNPFGFGNVTKLLDENRKPAEWWWDYLEFNEVFTENEFYVLFTDGMLVKKGRSKFRTSQYIQGERFKSFNQVYEKG
jgi:hypothetical protein